MYHLATLFPAAKRYRLPFSRDQLMLIMLALNELLLGVETLIAHLISGTIVPYEWIPIIFGPTAAILLVIAGLIAQRKRATANAIATVVFLTSIAIGLLGAYFHLVRAMRPYALPGDRFSVPLLVWAPPILGPLTFALVGLLGISSVWIEDPPDSGILRLLRGKRIQLPLSKTRALFFIIGLASLATVISSVLDHARTDFSNPWLWIPTSVGVFATVVAVVLGFIEEPSRGDIFTYFAAMVLMLLVGVVGFYLHISEDLTSKGTLLVERFIRGAPPLAPLLFTNIGALGLIVLLDPDELKYTKREVSS
jgi:hypothetical protein